MTREAIVVGSGPNGLVAAIVLARAGWDVTVLEAASTPGGGTRTEELTLPGVLHDVCSAIHPLGGRIAGVPRARRGSTHARRSRPRMGPSRTCRSPTRSTAGGPPCSHRDVDDTADGLGADGAAYRRLFGPLVEAGFDLTDGLLSPFTIPPRHPLALARYGVVGHPSARTPSPGAGSTTDEARALFAGLVGPLDPVARQAPVDRRLRTDARRARPPRRMADGPWRIAADRRCPGRRCWRTPAARWSATRRSRRSPSCRPPTRSCSTSRPVSWWRSPATALPRRYRKRRSLAFRYGAGVFKLDWALDGPIPWTNPDCARAATVHVGGTLDEIAASEAAPHAGRHAEQPVRAARPAVVVRRRSRPRRHAHGVGVLPRAERIDGRHDRPDRGPGRALRPRLPRPDPRRATR